MVRCAVGPRTGELRVVRTDSALRTLVTERTDKLLGGRVTEDEG